MAVKDTEQIRQLVNNVVLAGKLAELKVTKGNTKKNVPYISLKGAVQCGEDPVYTVRFRSFSQKTKADGTDSKMYSNLVEWAKKAVPMTKDKENCTMFQGRGSISMNDFINKDNKLVESVEFNINNFSDFREYKCDIDLEGFIYSITDETKGEDGDTTGRKIMRVISKENIGNNIVDLKKVIVTEENVPCLDEFEIEAKKTLTMYISLIPNREEEPKKRGFGKQRTTNGNAKLEYIMVGADEPLEEDNKNSLSPALIKKAMNERKIHLKEVEDKGYLGGNSESTTNTASENSADKMQAVDDDDEFPF